MRGFNLLAAATLSVVAAAHADAATITLKAVATTSIADTGYHYVDNMLRSYEQPGFTVNGFMRFDLSAIADTAVINSATLTAYTDTSFNSPYNAPQSAIYLVDYDGWANSYSDPSNPALVSKVSPTLTAFPTAAGSAVSWTIATSAVSANLADNLLSLAMHGEKGSYSYVYFSGNAIAATTPTLVIDYTPAGATGAVPEPATWAMLLLGFGGVGYTLRRRPKAGARIRFA